jgi:hypothetical protein
MSERSGIGSLRPIKFNGHKTNHTAKAVETTYNGQTFRSRLEARWAIVFDLLDISWEYEPQLFRTPRGHYLPDFKIKVRSEKKSCFVEVKGPEPIPIDYERAANIAYQTGMRMRFLVGAFPSFEPGAVRTFTDRPYPRFTRALWIPATKGELASAVEKARKACWGNKGQYIPYNPEDGEWS